MRTFDFYIGSAVDITRRWKAHISLLRRGEHRNIHLQRAWDKYGVRSFFFSVVEFVEDPKSLIESEQRWIDKCNPAYNICKIAESSLGVKRSEETRLHISEAHKGQKAWNKGKKMTEGYCQTMSKSKKGCIPWMKGKEHTAEAKEKMSLAKKGKATWIKGKKHTEETRRKMSDYRKKNPSSWMKGKKHTEVAKKKMSDTKFKKGFTPWNKGKKTGTPPWNKGLKGFMKGRVTSEETKKKISEAAKNRQKWSV